MGKTGPFTYYHVKNRPLMHKKPKGCKPTQGRVIKYPGRNIKIKECAPPSKKSKAKHKKKK